MRKPLTTNLSDFRQRSISWRRRIGHGAWTKVAALTGYSVQQVSHVMTGRKANLVLVAYVAGAASEPWVRVAALLPKDSPESIRTFWATVGREAWGTGMRGDAFAVPAANKQFGSLVTRHSTRLKTPSPPRGSGDNHRGARLTLGGAGSGNGAKTDTASKPTGRMGAAVGGAQRAHRTNAA